MGADLGQIREWSGVAQRRRIAATSWREASGGGSSICCSTSRPGSRTPSPTPPAC